MKRKKCFLNQKMIIECEECKNSCYGKRIEDEDKDCINFISRRISAEEKFLREHFFYNKKEGLLNEE